MNKVVYVLGAGFSAPLGLPVTSNFLMMARDQYFSNKDSYGYFYDIFKQIDMMSKIKNFYSSDLYNIEEILSILEMSQSVTSNGKRADFLRFICDVINYHTPDIQVVDPLPGNWHDHLCSGNSPWYPYGLFVANLIHLKVTDKHMGAHGLVPRERFLAEECSSATSYSIVTLNYDLIIEKYIGHLNSVWGYPGRIDGSERGGGISLAKLHGSVESGLIVPPTWNKGLSNDVLPAWQNAHRILSEANHIRVIGYSLPSSDAYVRYLFKSSCLESRNLKSFDVICLDGDGAVKGRYDEFIAYPGYRFFNQNTLSYLQCLRGRVEVNGKPTVAQYASMEDAHQAFVRQAGG